MNAKRVVLQGHMDMVCEKNNDVQHDFEKDPIETYIDGEWVRARGTTLGADNGIGMAASLAVLVSDDLVHGPIEALFTVDEETGLTGANNLGEGMIEGDILLNLDSEEDGEICIGCAGGIDTTVTFHYKQSLAPERFQYFKINITGLQGGHSGTDINTGRACANKLLARFLWDLSQDYEISLSSINGGNLRNAIAREAHAVVGIHCDHKEELSIRLNRYIADIENEYKHIEKEQSSAAYRCARTLHRCRNCNGIDTCALLRASRGDFDEPRYSGACRDFHQSCFGENDARQRNPYHNFATQPGGEPQI